MTAFEEIATLEKKGKLKMYLKLGLLPIKIKFYYDIYNEYLVELKEHEGEKGGRMQSISNVAENNKVTDKTVYNALNLMMSKT